MMTTADEFLEFAREMGLGQVKSTSITPLSNGDTSTGLSVLNNLCFLIEQIHQLKTENERLRAHLDLINHTERFFLKAENHCREKKTIRSTISSHDGEIDFDEDKSSTISPSNSLKIKKNGSFIQSISSRERQDFITHEDLSSTLSVDNNLGISNVPKWNRVRDALKFSLRQKPIAPTSPTLPHTDRIIPAISISIDDDDIHTENTNYYKKKKKQMHLDHRLGLMGEDSDQDDEPMDYNRTYHKRELRKADSFNSTTNDRQYTSKSNTLDNVSTNDENNLLTRKQSKIARYRRKLYSKLDTVKKQFSDPSPPSPLQRFTHFHGPTFGDIGSGLNHALLTAKLAPAMTKAYQQKMRDWQTMQKSNFLVDYRRQSVVNKTEVIKTDSLTSSIIPIIYEIPDEKNTLSIDSSDSKLETHLLPLSPIISPSQRSFLVYQWREIMSEEILLRHYSEYLQNKMDQLKRLETDLKTLKTNIFCTNNQDSMIKHRSTTSLDQSDQYKQTHLLQRSRSFQSLVTMPNSWILAVQSAAYSDILDGTSEKRTERAIIFNKNFFSRLDHFKHDRQHFEQDTLKDLNSLRTSKKKNSYEETLTQQQQPMRASLNRGCLRKLSLISPSEIPQVTTTILKSKAPSHIDLLSTPATSEPDQTLPSSSSVMFNKRSKRSRFDLKKTLQRSKSMCMTQLNTWFQRHRPPPPPISQQLEQDLSIGRRKSAIDQPKSIASPSSTPKFLRSPRLVRLHQRLFKHNILPSAPSSPPTEIPSTNFPVSASSPTFDDSDEHFKKQDLPVRIYLPPRTPTAIRHVRITDNNTTTTTTIDNDIKSTPMLKLASPIANRRYLSSTAKITTYESNEIH